MKHNTTYANPREPADDSLSRHMWIPDITDQFKKSSCPLRPSVASPRSKVMLNESSLNARIEKGERNINFVGLTVP